MRVIITYWRVNHCKNDAFLPVAKRMKDEKHKKPALRRGSQPDEAAKLAIERNISKIFKFYAMAGDGGSEDTEVIHQLRVSSRRAGEAIDLFAPCIPKNELRPLKKAVKRIRRAAGSARDWDVFLDGLGGWSGLCSAKEIPGADFLAAFALGSRRAAQLELDSLRGSLAVDALKQMWSAAENAVRLPKSWADLELGEFARKKISGRLEACLNALSESESSEQMHQARIEAKRLRYALEILGGHLEDCNANQLQSDAEHIQESLGAIHDSQVAYERAIRLSQILSQSFPEVWDRVGPGVMAFADIHQRACREKMALFLKERPQLLKIHFVT
jgi:CHAD domain-containing protein